MPPKRRNSASSLTTRKRSAMSASSTISSSADNSESSDDSVSGFSPSSESGKSAVSDVSKASEAPVVSAKSHASEPSSQPEKSKSASDSTICHETTTDSTPKDLTVAKVSTDTHAMSAREPSHDDTVFLPSLQRPQPDLNSGAIISFQHADAFPVFMTGDVIIRTEPGPSQKEFRLHSDVLARHSPYFANDLQISASDNSLKWFSYTIENINGKASLVSHQTKGERPALSYKQPEVIDGIVIKMEEVADEAPTVSKALSTTLAARKNPPNIEVAVKHYSHIFGTFYSIPPLISGADIGSALKQTESLVEIATSLGSLHLLRPYVANSFSQYRQALFLAIRSDPARWLKLAIPLQNRSIYTECLIHLIGVFPRWEISWPTKRTALTEDMRNLVKRKSEELDRKRIETERDLLLTTIPYGRKNLPLDPTERGHQETWTAVQVFRDQLAQRIDELDRTTNSLSRGHLFRSLKKGTLACLETGRVRNICKAMIHSDWAELDGDMRLLRGHAAKLVAELAANELMIDADNVGYLTCAEIKDEDVPW